MLFKETKLKGAYIIELEPLEDERGYFARSFCVDEFKKNGINFNIVQCNTSYNKKKGTLRGMHYQAKPHEEAKLVSCTKGAIYDVIIDLREDSPTFRKWIAVELVAPCSSGTAHSSRFTDHSCKMLYVPEGFAHGFQSLEDDTEVFYQMSEFYHPESTKGLRWDDPAFNISWPLDEPIVSERDRSYLLI